jgi:hypothetical protein
LRHFYGDHHKTLPCASKYLDSPVRPKDHQIELRKQDRTLVLGSLADYHLHFEFGILVVSAVPTVGPQSKFR